MRVLLHWASQNPINIIAGVLAAVAVAVLVMVSMSGSSFVEEMGKRNTVIREIDSLKRSPVVIPASDPDQPPLREEVAINQAAIEALENTYKRMSEEYTGIRDYCDQLNSHLHTPMMENLFPTPADAGVPFTARDVYQERLRGMLRPFEEDTDMPRLNAGMPPAADVIEAEMLKIERDFLTTEFFPPKEKVEDLNEEDLQRLRAKQTERLIKMLRNTAESIHLYAQTDLNHEAFPFEVGQWSRSNQKPSLSELWEGQMGLWIQQDIARAIMWTNESNNPSINVIGAPIKRLVKITIVPGYVGLNSDGGLFFEGSNQVTSSGTEGIVAPLEEEYLEQPIEVGPDRGGTPQPGAVQQPRRINTYSADKPLPDEFAVSPTGRRSNVLYDVRHAIVTVIIESERMPQFFNNLSEVNFMTVLKAEAENVDEFDAMRQGFLYGPRDVVQLTLTLETIWLRNWTSKVMPKEVRVALGIEEALAEPATVGN